MTAVCLALAEGEDVIEVGSTSIRPLEIFMSGSREKSKISLTLNCKVIVLDYTLILGFGARLQAIRRLRDGLRGHADIQRRHVAEHCHCQGNIEFIRKTY